MKKKIAEALYGMIAIIFLILCTARFPEQGGDGQVNFERPAADATKAPTEKALQSTDSAESDDAETGMVTPEAAASIATGPTKAVTPAPTAEPTKTVTPVPTAEPTKAVTPVLTAVPEATEPSKNPWQLSGAIEIKNENYEQYSNELNAWWFVRKDDHSPSGSGEGFPIAPYSAFYRNTKVTEEDKVVYLTFDCGYENGFTPAILDTLAEKGVKALFFVTKNFVVENPEYVKRMKEEGHLVGNHTVRHLSSPSLTPEELETELNEVAKTMYELTGYTMDPFFRPPMGEYSERILKVAQDMGYSSVFWSIAYFDYDVNNQPGKDYVVDHFAAYHHNGTIVLMHNISESDTEALGDVIDLLRAEGYRFGMLTEMK